MSSIRLHQVAKSFGVKQVIHNIDLAVEHGAFLVLLGPSGCGKSTVLRMLAGLETVSGGEIYVGERRVDQLPPSERDMAFVFQSYALYPHLTVRRNIAFPLLMERFHWWYHLPIVGGFAKRRIENAPAVRDRVERTAQVLALSEMMDRFPRTLSGGQRQRVALGRAMVRQPEVFLMDEPLSNLDAKLRSSMRTEISRLHREIGGTFVYVTHDQVEAMTMGTQIALMRDGIIQQFGAARDIYDDPANTFVARFIGTPPMNLVELDSAGTLGGVRLPLPEALAARSNAEKRWCAPGDQAEAPWQSEARTIAQAVPGSVTSVEHIGAESIVSVALARGRTAHEADGDTDAVMATVQGYSDLQPGERGWVVVRLSRGSALRQGRWHATADLACRVANGRLSRIWKAFAIVPSAAFSSLRGRSHVAAPLCA